MTVLLGRWRYVIASRLANPHDFYQSLEKLGYLHLSKLIDPITVPVNLGSVSAEPRISPNKLFMSMDLDFLNDITVVSMSDSYM